MRALLQRCGSVGAPCVRSPCPCVPAAVFCVRSRLLFDAQRQTDRLAICCVPIPAWVGIAFRAFSCVGAVIGRVGFTSGLCIFCRRFRRSSEGTRGTGDGRTESAARQCALLREHIGLAILSAGSTLGAARPQTCAKETSLPGLSSFDSRPCALYAGRACALCPTSQ